MSNQLLLYMASYRGCRRETSAAGITWKWNEMEYEAVIANITLTFKEAIQLLDQFLVFK